MMKQFSCWSVFSALVSRVHGLPGWPMGGTIVTGNAVQFDRDTWEAALSRPNATGDNSITGLDISQKWPSKQVDGWHLSINVTSDIPDSQTLTPTNATGQTFTGTSIYVKAPEDLQTALSNDTAIDESTWKICVVVIPNAPQDNTTVAEDGTCQIISSQCVADLQQAYTDKFPRNQDCYGTPPSTPSSCGDALNTGNFNVQQLPLDSISGREVFVTASEPHDPNDENARDDATQKTWPVLMIWGWNERANAPDDASPTVQLSCISARDASSGDGSDGDHPPSAASRDCSSPSLAAFIVAGVAAYALL